MIAPEHERPRPPGGEGFGDSVSFSFADPSQEVYGIARVGLAADDGSASALAVLFSGDEPVAARVDGGLVPAGSPWEDVEVAGIRARTMTPLGRWRIDFAGDGASFGLDFAAASPALELGSGRASAASGVEGYEHLCQVEGEVSVRGRRRQVRCLGQRGHGWGAAPWERIELARTVSAWLEGPRGVALSAVRPLAAVGHGEEALTAFLVEPRDGQASAIEVAEPRLSTTYDPDGRQRRAGLELWVDEDDELPRRIAGEVTCGTSLELGRLRLDCSFFTWRMEGDTGAGRYDVLRRT